ncbi:MAG: DNA methyltransferase [Pseudomonadota bacterium]
MESEVFNGDATQTLRKLEAASVDLIVTDPPYLVRYRDRNERRVANDDNAEAVLPAFEEMFRVLKRNRYCVCFCGWTAIAQFSAAWNAAGFRTVGQIVWQKDYASKAGHTEYRHETAYLLTKGRPSFPSDPIADVQAWHYSGNRHHPTEKSVPNMSTLIKAFSKPGDLVLDPFLGSGTTAVAAVLNRRKAIGVELEERYCELARRRLAGAERFVSNQANEAA